jgi:predicted ATPase/class 3 adenylate cyclase
MAQASGMVTFLFTDIEGSTRLARAHEAAFPTLLDRHRELLRSAFAAGREVDSAGDAFFVVFERASDALAAAAEGQRLLAAEPWTGGVALRVRMGLHTGACQFVGNHCVGAEVHRAARICAAAHGGQVLASDTTAAQNADSGIGFRELGDFQLKDFDEPQPLLQVEAPGLLGDFPPPRTAEARVVSIPREWTSLVGREDDLATIEELVLSQRLVTLTGTGGSGKTRLAIRAARDLAPRFRGPVVFVPLVAAADAGGVVPLLARALGVNGLLKSWDDALEILEPQNALIVWDNTEHLPDVGSRIAEIRDRCERLHCLVTSRASLGVPGEWLYPVEPLGRTAATQLLRERALQLQPSFDAERSADVLDLIAARLEGLPLALELAAARFRSVPPRAVLERLDSQLDLLGDPGTTPNRHATLRAALQWSFDLLEPGDRTVFTAASVFPAPARLEAIAAVAVADHAEALHSITRLIDASLVRLDDSTDHPRYRLLEPVRQYAYEQLDAAGNRETAEKRMVQWYLDEARDAQHELERFVRAFRSDGPNILRALAHAQEASNWNTVAELAFRTMGGVFGLAGQSAVVQPFVESAAANRRSMTPAGLAFTALGVANLDDKNPVLWRKAVDQARASGQADLLGEALNGLALMSIDAGELEEAGRALDQVEALGLTYPEWRVNVPLNRAVIAEYHRDPAAAAFWAAAEQAARASDVVDLVRALWFIAGGEIVHDRPARAAALINEALASDDTWDYWVGTELALRHRGATAELLAGDTERAAAHLQRALVIWNRVSSSDRYADTPGILLTSSALLGAGGADLASAALLAHVEPQLDDPIYDHHGVRGQLAIAHTARDRLGTDHQRSAAEAGLRLDTELALRLALDETAAIAARPAAPALSP